MVVVVHVENATTGTTLKGGRCSNNAKDTAEKLTERALLINSDGC